MRLTGNSFSKLFLPGDGYNPASSATAKPAMALKPCVRCKVSKPPEGFYRRRKTGNGKFRGADARRSICIPCERAAYPPKPYVPTGGKRGYNTQMPTRNGIREKLIAQGLVPGTRVYKTAYTREWGRKYPTYRAAIQVRYRVNMSAGKKAARAKYMRDYRRARKKEECLHANAAIQ